MRSIIVIVVLVLSLISCKEFQTETFTASDKDLSARNAIADSVSIDFSTELLTTYDLSWKNKGLDTISVALYDSLLANDIALSILDTAYTVSVSSKNDTSYAIFSGTESDITVYIGDYMELRLVDQNGDTRLPDDKSWDLAAIYENLNGVTSTSYDIKSRYVFKALPQKTIFQFLRNDQVEVGKYSFKLIINQ